MSGIAGIGGAGGVRPDHAGGVGETDDAHERLRRVSNEFQGLFLKQMLDAMRKSIPDSGLLESSSAEDTFTSLLDDRLASAAAQRTQGGLGEAIYRQLARRLDSDPSASR